MPDLISVEYAGINHSFIHPFPNFATALRFRLVVLLFHFQQYYIATHCSILHRASLELSSRYHLRKREAFRLQHPLLERIPTALGNSNGRVDPHQPTIPFFPLPTTRISQSSLRQSAIHLIIPMYQSDRTYARDCIRNL